MTTHWTDTELDEALAALHETPPVTSDHLAAQRTALLDLMDAQSPRSLAARRSPRSISVGRGLRWLTIAAVLITCAVVAPSLITHNGQPVASASASPMLIKAADAITISAQDPAVPTGAYRKVTTHAWTMTVTGPYAFLSETVITKWIPANSADTTEPWLLRHTDTGKRQWIVGTPEEAAAAGKLPTATATTTEYKGLCGDFFGDTGGCNRAGSWQDPSPRFLADLPRDPDQLKARLAAAAPPDSGAAGMFKYALDTLNQGVAPADLRAALYRVLSTLPDIVITQNSVNLDGRPGTALGIQTPGTREDAIIDPTTGQFIGTRSVQTDQANGVAAGATIGWSAVQTEVVQTR